MAIHRGCVAEVLRATEISRDQQLIATSSERTGACRCQKASQETASDRPVLRQRLRRSVLHPLLWFSLRLAWLLELHSGLLLRVFAAGTA